MQHFREVYTYRWGLCHYLALNLYTLTDKIRKNECLILIREREGEEKYQLGVKEKQRSYDEFKEFLEIKKIKFSYQESEEVTRLLVHQDDIMKLRNNY